MPRPTIDSNVAPLAAAPGYAERGWPVFPCRPGAKEPLTAHGWQDATTSASIIETWQRRWPRANIAIAAGLARLAVVDLDPRHGGFESWERLNCEHGPLSRETLTVHTPHGGIHLYFRVPDGITIPSSTGRLGPGIDVRSRGGYILAPPSRLADAGAYRWRAGVNYDTEPVRMPEVLLTLVQLSWPRATATRGSSLPATIPTGGRNSTLMSLAGTMRRRGMTLDEIAAALSVVNQRRCTPPLSDEEVERITKSAGRYAPASQDRTPRRPRIRWVARHA
jgi:Bifunctional DNA primase/polymerase, N-terminal/Primase C terminal 1 (PriCT-1)